MSESLFDYRLRVSRKARNVYLRVTPEHGLEIVVPRGFDSMHIPKLLRDKERWIRKALARADVERAWRRPNAPWALPSEIHFQGIARTWYVVARPSADPVKLHAEGHGVIVCGRIDDERACRDALKRWLVAQAAEHLTPILKELSEQFELPYRRVSYRRQRSRWGSCSRQRSISLNVKLLFLAPDVVRYVMVHELCHIMEMNHSRRFWSLVERHHPGARDCDRRLRDAWRLVPSWAAH